MNLFSECVVVLDNLFVEERKLGLLHQCAEDTLLRSAASFVSCLLITNTYRVEHNPDPGFAKCVASFLSNIL